ncbi:hypothetical protein ACVWWG_001719 [Bradyrhizobium sp. LB7.2]
MVVIASSETAARSLAAPAYETWLKSFKFLYDLNDIPPPSNLPLTLDAAIESELCVVGKSWSRLSEQNLRVDKWSVCRG